jgi:hypothetical protein
VVVLATALIPASALAGGGAGAPVPGATYTGTGTDGAAVTFSVSSDGTLLISYQITGVEGDTCELNAGGDAGGAWPGTPIVNNSFDYKFYDDVVFDGTFTGPQTASGTFYLHNDAFGRAKACSSPTVQWTANTKSKPVGKPPPKGSVATLVSLRLMSKHKLGGRISASAAACVVRRRITLWRGSRKLGSTRATARGAYSFVVSAKVRGREVRATVAKLSVTNAVCAAGSSTFVKA